VTRVETFLLEEIIGEKSTFPEYKLVLQNRFKKLKKHLLLPYQKVFYQRVMSELDDRKSWLSSISHARIGKPLDLISDDDEKILYDKLKDIVHEMDNLCDLSKADMDEEKEDVLKLEITSFVEGIKKNLVRMPKSKNKEIIKMENQIKPKLSKDNNINVTVLIRLLNEVLKDEK
jgi:HrpA-like RNA helicase